ncbi:MAG: PhnD/SsuA/transferrin family substrate-binding protein [Deltaproteobacteria bacterium]|nr:PhnD/SsuA/transferrin family substrate-binding protein [Deltaproteobacteria bacterium]
MSRAAFIAAALMLWGLVLGTPGAAPAGPARPLPPVVRLAVTDLEGYPRLDSEFGAFARRLGELAGCRVELVPVQSRTSAVEALTERQVDLVLTGPAEYVVFHQLTNARPLVAFSRPDYFAGILVLAEREPHTIGDLKGKTVLFGDVGSTSFHLAPMQILADHGLNPLRDIRSLHLSRHDLAGAWRALKEGQVDALGMNYTTLWRLQHSDPDLEPGAFRFLARGPDLPSDVLLVGGHVPPAVKARLSQAFTGHEASLIAALLLGEDNRKYRGMKFLTTVKDSDYDYVRSMYRTIGFPRFSRFIQD